MAKVPNEARLKNMFAAKFSYFEKSRGQNKTYDPVVYFVAYALPVQLLCRQQNVGCSTQSHGLLMLDKRVKTQKQIVKNVFPARVKHSIKSFRLNEKC